MLYIYVIVSKDGKQIFRAETPDAELQEVKIYLSIDYGKVPGSFPNPVVSVGVCYTAMDAAGRLDHGSEHTPTDTTGLGKLPGNFP